MGVKRLLADAELIRQIIHGHAAEAVTKEMRSRRLHDALPPGFGLSTPRFACGLHVFLLRMA